MDNVYSENTDISSVTSGESSVIEGYSGETETDNVVPAGANATEAEAKKTFNTGRITAFAEWVVNLDNNPESLRAADANINISSDSDNVHAAAATGKLTDLAKSEGPDEINADYSRNNIPFPSSESLSSARITYKDDNGKFIYLNYWDVNRRTRLKYDVYSIHSFTRKSDGKGRDYFLIRASGTTNTTKQFFKVKNEIVPSSTFGNNDAHALWGFTRRLKFNNYIEEDTGDGSVILAASIPEAKDTAQTKSSSISYSFGAAVAMSSKPPSDRKKSDTREGEAAPSFNVGIGYTDTVSNTAIDYKILRGTRIYGHTDLAVRLRTDSNKRANVSYEFEFAWPKLGREIGDWDDDARLCYQELEAWPSSKEHTSQLEWIWELKPDIWKRTKNNMLTVWVYAEWTDGLSQGPYFRRIGSYWGDRVDREFNKKGVWRKFTLYKPMYMAVTPVSFAPAAGTNAFNKNAGSASFALLSEYKWVIKSKPDWLSDFTAMSGEPTAGTAHVITFKYSANNTGKPRTGDIVIGSSENNNDTRNITIKVTQGAN